MRLNKFFRILRFVLLSMMLIDCFSLNAQEKRISSKKVPEPIKNYISKNCYPIGKIKYYLEMDNDTLFIEAEFETSIDSYSLKFLTSGEHYQTERNISFNKIVHSTKTKIDSSLKKNYGKFKIIKCQEKQIRGQTLYEITLRGKSTGKRKVYELHFNTKGEIVMMEEKESRSIISDF